MTIVSSAFLGNHLVERIGRNKLLSLWIILGVCSSGSLLLLSFSDLPVICAVSILLGFSLGLGFPSCVAYFGDYLTNERRGLLGGGTFIFTFAAVTLGGFLSTLTNFTISIVGFSLWRLLALPLFLLLKTDEEFIQTKVAYFKILRERPFLLYFIPWTIFSVINWFEVPFFDTQLQRQYLDTNLSYMIALAEFGIGGISAFIGGYLSDRIGRKRLIIAAYAMMGVGYAVLSLASQNKMVFYSYILLDGTAWGIFFLMFFVVIWGDFAQSRIKNRYYLIGFMPFIVSSYITPIVRPFIGAIPLFSAFSFASFFLFLAVIPLMVAPETLPEKTMKERELKSYAEKALKEAAKQASKKKGKEAEGKENEEGTQQPPEYDEARKLAEKYY